MKLLGSEVLIQALIDHGVYTVFGYPGGSVLDIYDALYKKSDEIDHILTAHEQGAAHAADGYARTTGRPGVVIATSGPGATNLVTGIATAYLDSVPLVAFTGNVATSAQGRDSFQEVDIVGVSLPIVKHSFSVRSVDDLEETIHQAFEIAMDGRKGPVLVDIPKDIQQGLTSYKGLAKPVYEKEKKDPDLDYSKAIEAIKNCQRPYIYVGGGAVGEDLGDKLLDLSRKIGGPIATTLMGKTAIPASYDLALGVMGMHGTRAANLAQDQSDLVIGIGVRFSDRATGDVNQYVAGKTFIHIDIDPAEMEKNIMDVIPLEGDTELVLDGLLPRLEGQERKDWVQWVKAMKEENQALDGGEGFSPRNIIQRINNWTPEDSVVATDVGQHQMWVMQHYKFEKARRFLSSGGAGTMGYGLGAAIGGAIGNDRKKTVLFTGDGSFGMNLNELATAVTQKLPILIVLFNNQSLGMVRQWQARFYDERFSATNLSMRKTDFVDLIRAFGGDGTSVDTLAELDKVLAEDPVKDGPYLVECMIGRDDEVLPMIPAGMGVKDMIIG